MNKSKRPVSLLLLIALVAVWAVPALAETVPSQESDFEFTLDNGTATITKYTGDAASVVIPAKLADVNVAAIGTSAFQDKALSAVSFPETLTRIGETAFADCANLANVSLPASLEDLGPSAFTACHNLRTVSFAADTTRLEEGAFAFCESLESVQLPSAIQSIPDQLFMTCTGLKQVSIPDTCTSIGAQAFQNCSGLSEVMIPNTCTSIGAEAFRDCSSAWITLLTDRARTIGKDALTNCGWLTIVFDGFANDFDTESLGMSQEAGIGTFEWFPLRFTNAPFTYRVLEYRSEKDGNAASLGTAKLERITADVVPAVLSVPETVTTSPDGGGDKYAVTEIGAGALADDAVQKIVLPESIRVVPPDALPQSEEFKKGSDETGLHVDGTMENWLAGKPAQSLNEAGYIVRGETWTYPRPSATKTVDPQPTETAVPTQTATKTVDPQPTETAVPIQTATKTAVPEQSPAAEKCTYCGSTEHRSADCPESAQPTETPEELCSVCGIAHGTEPCPLAQTMPPLPPAAPVTPLAPLAPAAPAPASAAVSAAPSASASAEPDESPEPSAYELPAKPLDTSDMEIWDIVPVEDARRLNGQFSFEARGNLVDIEQARQSIKKWAEETFDSEATVTFESEKNAARARSAQSGIHTDDMVYVETSDGRRAVYDVAVRGDVSGGDGEDAQTASLTQLVNIVSVIMAEQAQNADIEEQSAAPPRTARMAAASTRPAAKPSVSVGKDKLTSAQKEAADVNGNGRVTITDAVQQAKYMTAPHADGPVYPDGPKHTSWESDNMGLQGYMNSRRWARLSSSYLMENPKGGLSRVEYVGDGILVEDYDKDLNLVMSRTIPMELEKWGGFYSGERYNYFVFGQDNDEESKDKEVVRVVQYSKSWKRIASDSMYGANTSSPFLAGALRCDEYKGHLYIRTCHNMFTNEDGIRHQANMLIVVRERDMKITDSEADVVWGTGLVSHSFNQFVFVDRDGKLVALDHGDGNPRAIALRRYLTPAGDDKIVVADGQSMEVETANIQEIIGDIGDNDTGCSLGGFQETQNGYVAAYGYDGKGDRHEPRNIYFSFTDRDLKKTVKTQLTKNEDVQVPMLVSTGFDGGYIMWAGKPDENRDRLLNYAHYDKNGKLTKTQTMKAAMSDCQPIVWNGKIIWYVTDESGPVFYTLPI